MPRRRVGAFDARRIELMDGSHLNERKFDEMMEAIFRGQPFRGR
jgi:hypothetical protein